MITDRKGKVMASQASVCLWEGKGISGPMSFPGVGYPWYQVLRAYGRPGNRSLLRGRVTLVPVNQTSDEPGGGEVRVCFLV